MAPALLLLVYMAAYFGFARLGFAIEKDELHFWPTVLFFSHHLLPTAEQLRSYNDLNTPVPFLIFGAIESWFHQGLWLARLSNLLMSLTCAAIILLPTKNATRDSALATLGLLCFPYFVGVSTHVYTDTIAAAFTLGGVALFMNGHRFVSLLFFVAAVSSRQYAVIFPAALLLFLLRTSWAKRQSPDWISVGCLTASLFSLVSWFIFWGGPANAVALNSQVVATTQWLSFLPENVGYFLACVATYYCLPEFLFFSASRELFKQRFAQRKKVAVIVVMIVSLFALFPPLGNHYPYPIEEMGFLDKGLRLGFNDFWRVVALCGLAIFAVIRFAEDSLPAYFVVLNAVLMAKAHIAWDKYVFSLLLVLWWFRSDSNRLNSQKGIASGSVAIRPGTK